jgi:ATP-dependent DNA ligase
MPQVFQLKAVADMPIYCAKIALRSCHDPNCRVSFGPRVSSSITWSPLWTREQPCIAFRDRDAARLQSRNQKPLNRYFPEIEAAMLALPVRCFVLDGEIIIRGQPFDVLQLRLHPASSRVATLAEQYPASFVAFDLLAGEDGKSMLARPFSERRAALDVFFKRFDKSRFIIRSRGTRSRAQALKWCSGLGHGLDGIMAKPLAEPYRPGQRTMQKYKLWKTVDCVVGGYYPRPGGRQVEYLLLGLYDDEGRLNYVGRARAGDGEIMELLQPLIGGDGFTGRSPSGKSRWSNRERRVVPLRPRLVVEASADHIENERFRHGARLLRFREDKKPEACTMDQIIPRR